MNKKNAEPKVKIGQKMYKIFQQTEQSFSLCIIKIYKEVTEKEITAGNVVKTKKGYFYNIRQKYDIASKEFREIDGKCNAFDFSEIGKTIFSDENEAIQKYKLLLSFF